MKMFSIPSLSAKLSSNVYDKLIWAQTKVASDGKFRPAFKKYVVDRNLLNVMNVSEGRFPLSTQKINIS